MLSPSIVRSNSSEKRLPDLQALVVSRDVLSCALLARWLEELGVAAVFAQSFEEASSLVDDCGPDLVVLDLDLDEEETALRLSQSTRLVWGAAVVFLCGGDEGALRALGAMSVFEPCAALSKPFHRAQLRLTVQLALRRAASPAFDEPGLADLLSRLTPREREITGLVLERYRVPAIAASLGITVTTVRRHLKNAFGRLGVRTQRKLIERLDRAGR
jgi:DNA-binding NarL/FixJ family response regulator